MPGCGWCYEPVSEFGPWEPVGTTDWSARHWAVRRADASKRFPTRRFPYTGRQAHDRGDVSALLWT